MKNETIQPTIFMVNHASFFLCFSLFSSFFLILFTPKKREGKFWIYFSFFSAQKAATPIIDAIATAAMMATSVVIKG